MGRESRHSTSSIELRLQCTVLLKSGSPEGPHITPTVEGGEQAVGGKRLTKEKLEYQACSLGSRGGPTSGLSLLGRSPKSRYRQLTSKHQI